MTGLFGGKQPPVQTPVIPEPEPVAPMADPNDVLLRERKKKQAAQKQAFSGRQSTILSDGEKLGG